MSSWILPDELIRHVMNYMMPDCFVVAGDDPKIYCILSQMITCRNYITALGIDCGPQFTKLFNTYIDDLSPLSVLEFVVVNDLWQIFEILINKFRYSIPKMIFNDGLYPYAYCLDTLLKHNVGFNRVHIKVFDGGYSYIFQGKKYDVETIMMTCDLLVKHKLLDTYYCIGGIIANRKIPESCIIDVIRKYNIPCYVYWLWVRFTHRTCEDAMLEDRYEVVRYMFENLFESDKLVLLNCVSYDAKTSNDIDFICEIMRKHNIRYLLGSNIRRDEILKKLNIQ
jgi:hypothetical protein